MTEVGVEVALVCNAWGSQRYPPQLHLDICHRTHHRKNRRAPDNADHCSVLMGQVDALASGVAFQEVNPDKIR